MAIILRRFASVFVFASFVAVCARPVPDQRDDSLSWYEGFSFPTNESESSRPSVPRARPVTIDNEDDDADSSLSVAHMAIEILCSIVGLFGIGAGIWVAWKRRAAGEDVPAAADLEAGPPAVVVADAVARIRRIGELVRLLQRLRRGQR